MKEYQGLTIVYWDNYIKCISRKPRKQCPFKLSIMIVVMLFRCTMLTRHMLDPWSFLGLWSAYCVNPEVHHDNNINKVHMNRRRQIVLSTQCAAERSKCTPSIACRSSSWHKIHGHFNHTPSPSLAGIHYAPCPPEQTALFSVRR